jgi:hypothetical protein
MYHNLISQLFMVGQISIDVGVNTIFERQFYLPPNGINLRNDSLVISLSISAIFSSEFHYRFIEISQLATIERQGRHSQAPGGNRDPF